MVSPTQLIPSGEEGFILDAPRGSSHARNAPYSWSDGAVMLGIRPREVVRVDSWSGTRDVLEQMEGFVQRFEESRCAIAVGFLSYDLGGILEPTAASRHSRDGMPLVYFAAFDEYYSCRPGSRGLVRHRKGQPAERITRLAWSEGATPHRGAGSLALTRGPRSNFTREQYIRTVEAAREYILAGDIFEVNLSQRFSAPLGDEPLVLYERLREANPAPYAAFISSADFAILSCSPELFVRLEGDRIVTRPIKGTARRSEDQVEDMGIADALYSAEKENAELAMIVDLERNDLGRVCKYGSVRVVEAKRVETFVKVHHLVATIEGARRRGVGIVDVIRAAFPGGSVTGAPKIRAMQIIDELEPCARGVYTGAIGYMLPGGRAEFNIAIRTVVCKDEQIHLQVGGAVTADSDPALEYRETLDKAEAVLNALWQGAQAQRPVEPMED
jgi:para-aminobenzoate synthetase component 1